MMSKKKKKKVLPNKIVSKKLRLNVFDSKQNNIMLGKIFLKKKTY